MTKMMMPNFLKDHLKITWETTLFVRRDLFYFCMGSYIVCMSNDGGHLGFAINKKYKLFEKPSNDYSYIYRNPSIQYHSSEPSVS